MDIHLFCPVASSSPFDVSFLHTEEEERFIFHHAAMTAHGPPQKIA
jgi:hypothetical protein